MSGDSHEINLPKETETVPENNLNNAEKIKKNYCYLCNVQCAGNQNYKDHLAGRKHLKKQSSLTPCPSPQKQLIQQDKNKIKEKNNHSSEQLTEKVIKCKEMRESSSTSDSFLKHQSENFKGKNQDIQSCVSSSELTKETMNNSNKYQNKSPGFQNSYERQPFPRQNFYNRAYNRYRKNDYFEDRRYHGEQDSYYSNHSRMPHDRYSKYNYGRRDQYYSQYRYNASPANNYRTENDHSYLNSYENYGESSNSRYFEQNSEHSNPNCDANLANSFSTNASPVVNPFREFCSEEAVSPSKSREKVSTETNVGDINKRSVDSPKSFSNSPKHFSSTPKHFSSSPKNFSSSPKNFSSSPKKFSSSPRNSSSSRKKSPISPKENTVSKKHLTVTISKFAEKRTVVRSRSLSLSESDKKKGHMSDQTEPEESEEQRIREWTNSLLETNHNQITRLINPSNHKEKAAVNHLITKLSKSKRKECLKLRSLSTELNNNDDRNVNCESVNIETESVVTDDEDISIILDTAVGNSNLEQNVSNLHTPHSSKTNDSRHSNTNRDQSNKSSLSCKSPMNKNFETCSINDEIVEINSFSKNKSSTNSSPSRIKEKNVKRKSAGSGIRVKKKQKTATTKNTNDSNPSELVDLFGSEATLENIFGPLDSTMTSEENSSVSNVKEEVMQICGEIEAESNKISSETNLEQNCVFNPDLSVNKLMELFASGHVKVKEEFNDPIMEALKEINPDELNACLNSSLNACGETVNIPSISTLNRTNSKDKSHLEASKNTISNDKNCSVSDNVPPASVEMDQVRTDTDRNVCSQSVTDVINPALPKSPNVVKSKHQNQSLPGANVDNSVSDSNALNIPKVELPPYLNKLFKDLQNITSQEEAINKHLSEAKLKINEYTSLLEEWKGKEKKLQDEEDDLRKQRNTIINLLQNTIKTDGDDNENELASSLPKVDTLVNQLVNKEKQVENGTETADALESQTSHVIAPSITTKQKGENVTLPGLPDPEEITILPPPQKPQPPEIIICDDDENVSTDNHSENLRDGISVDASSSKKSLYVSKEMDAHATIINCMVVFEEFLYTCSNDNTAKRFNLKDTSQTVTYFHTAKNVTEVVVEKVQNEALVFTSCSARVISLFIASSGTKIKTFFPPCPVNSICSGWGKFYSGLANGCINMYNWKYEETELVRSEHAVARLAAAHQGRLHVLVVLSSEGHMAIRDAETGLLIRTLKADLKAPFFICLHNDLAYLSSSDKILILVEIMSGKIEKKLHMNCHSTGLAVYDDFIFSITYSGMINCYDKVKNCDKKIFYGAGKAGLTCIHIYNNWVFTGNRKGTVSVFYFDPDSSANCEFAKCDVIYGLQEDLEYHVHKDHVSKKKNLAQCSWRGCIFPFSKHATNEERMQHIKSHIYHMNYRSSIL